MVTDETTTTTLPQMEEEQGATTVQPPREEEEEDTSLIRPEFGEQNAFEPNPTQQLSKPYRKKRTRNHKSEKKRNHRWLKKTTQPRPDPNSVKRTQSVEPRHRPHPQSPAPPQPLRGVAEE
ncbi:activating signal cointegrator 1 complex subunit 2 homolog [Rosa chinensis]|uniref:activating signal cointegrator 1 complex subunit 2 homolog n=1 Tax=Rosa chinensis TaxID=74649 RepID=UPI000D08BF8C|nr:activating signal cointegrator 1 complex subunit 2 homolog [Rosa chinensis]